MLKNLFNYNTVRQKPEVNEKLYILVSNKLSPIYAAVQGGHAIAQFLIDHPNSKWKNNTVVYLSCDLEKVLYKMDKYRSFIKQKPKYDCPEMSMFYEPDLDNELTAIACYNIPQQYVKHLPLLK